MPDEILIFLIFAYVWITLYVSITLPIKWQIKKLRCEMYREILTLFSNCEENMFNALSDLKEDSQKCPPQQD